MGDENFKAMNGEGGDKKCQNYFLPALLPQFNQKKKKNIYFLIKEQKKIIKKK